MDETFGQRFPEVCIQRTLMLLLMWLVPDRGATQTQSHCQSDSKAGTQSVSKTDSQLVWQSVSKTEPIDLAIGGRASKPFSGF